VFGLLIRWAPGRGNHVGLQAPREAMAKALHRGETAWSLGLPGSGTRCGLGLVSWVRCGAPPGAHATVRTQFRTTRRTTWGAAYTHSRRVLAHPTPIARKVALSVAPGGLSMDGGNTWGHVGSPNDFSSRQAPLLPAATVLSEAEFGDGQRPPTPPRGRRPGGSFSLSLFLATESPVAAPK